MLPIVSSFVGKVSGGGGGFVGAWKWVWTRNRPVAVGLVIVVAVVKLRHVYKQRKRRAQWAKAGKDMVILHGLGKGIYTPSLSPFVMKLATYLRMAKIPYQMDFTEPFGPKGKSPWITINGESIGDSQLVMEYLGQHFNRDSSSHLTEEQKAVAWTFSIMIDEHICWCLRDWRWVLDAGRGVIQSANIPPMKKWILFPANRRRQIQAMKVQGIGRHSHQEIQSFVIKDLRAISKYLGKKPFLMGDKPCEVDCSVFGSLVQIKYNYPGSPYTDLLENEFANLGAYVVRMKELLWPDWDKCLDTPRWHH